MTADGDLAPEPLGGGQAVAGVDPHWAAAEDHEGLIIYLMLHSDLLLSGPGGIPGLLALPGALA
ncbi:MAG: hypothetical protein CMJ87_09475 [Planctomycetes bacterium]|jgi:hypothetical protein|nr:hypothetical protein [Planctomycetota bacterium]